MKGRTLSDVNRLIQMAELQVAEGKRAEAFLRELLKEREELSFPALAVVTHLNRLWEEKDDLELRRIRQKYGDNVVLYPGVSLGENVRRLEKERLTESPINLKDYKTKKERGLR